MHLYEDYPARYEADMSRQERWIRGDWQIAHWLLAAVPAAGTSEPAESALPAVALEDPRQPAAQPRTGGPGSSAAYGWFAAPQPLAWTLAIAGVVLIPPL